MQNSILLLFVTAVSALYNPMARFQRESVAHHEFQSQAEKFLDFDRKSIENENDFDKYVRHSLREIVSHLAEGPGDSHQFELEEPTEFKVDTVRSKQIIELATLRKQMNLKKNKNRRHRARGLWQRHHRRH